MRFYLHADILMYVPFVWQKSKMQPWNINNNNSFY